MMDAIRTSLRAGNLAIANAAQKTNTPIKQNSPAAKAVAATQPNNVVVTDPVTGKQLSVAPAGAGGYMQNYLTYANQQMANKAAAEQKYKSDLTANNQATNANFDNSARQAYVNYMKNQKNLGGQLANLGVNGGASETGQLNLYNQYGAEHAANEQQRAAELANNQRNYDQAVYDYNTAWQEKMNDALQTAMNNQMNEYNNELTKYSTSIARFTADKDGYKKAQKELKALKNGNDPLKNDKIQILEAEIARVFTKEVLDSFGKGGKKSGGGKSGGGSRRRGRGGSSKKSSGGGKTATGSGYTYKAPSKEERDKVTSYYKKSASSNKTGKNKNYFVRG